MSWKANLLSLLSNFRDIASCGAGGRAAKVAERDWQQRLQQQEQQWSLKQKDLEKRWAARCVYITVLAFLQVRKEKFMLSAIITGAS
jgi:hypothetical protein